MQCEAETQRERVCSSTDSAEQVASSCKERWGEGKSAEEVAFEKEAAEAIMKGELHFLSTLFLCPFFPLSFSPSLPSSFFPSLSLPLTFPPSLPPSLPSSLPLSLSQTFRRPSYMDWSHKTVVLWYLS